MLGSEFHMSSLTWSLLEAKLQVIVSIHIFFPLLFDIFSSPFFNIMTIEFQSNRKPKNILYSWAARGRLERITKGSTSTLFYQGNCTKLLKICNSILAICSTLQAKIHLRIRLIHVCILFLSKMILTIMLKTIRTLIYNKIRSFIFICTVTC